MIEVRVQKQLTGAQGVLALDIALSLVDQELVVLSGDSGAGKTSLLRMIAGLTIPDSGRIVVNGECWFDAQQRINVPTRLRSIGFVFQNFALFPHLSVVENIAYATRPEDAAWVTALLDMMGLKTLAHQKPDRLSGGQQQRVALARAVARKPALLLLDEPLSALDAEMRAGLQDSLQQLHQDLGLTSIMVSHDLGEIFKLADRVFRLEQGTIVRSGTAAALFLAPRAAGELSLQARVLAIRREDVVYILSLLVGKEVIDVIATEDDVAGLAPGAQIALSAGAFRILHRLN